jgi:hypothetical protein
MIHPILVLVVLGLICSTPAFACTCAYAALPQPDYGASTVFRGTVTERKLLTDRTEMRGRKRYAITFRVDESWKGSRAGMLIVYGMDDGSDCQGGSSYEIGKNSLVFADEGPSQDRMLGEKFWYGWTDVVPQGTRLLELRVCTPSGEISKVSEALKRLGKGSVPSNGQ